MTGSAFQEAVRTAMDKSRRDREERARCPVEDDGCGRKGSLCAISTMGIRLGSFCPYCRWSSFLFKGRRVTVELRGVARKKAKARKVRESEL